MDPEEAKAQELEYAVKFADLNRDLDMVVSPISVASRLNMGIPHEVLLVKNKIYIFQMVMLLKTVL